MGAVCRLLQHGRCQTRHQMLRQVRCIAGHTGQPWRLTGLEPGQQPGQRPGIVGRQIRHQRQIEVPVSRGVVIDVEQHAANLRRQTRRDMRQQRLTTIELQPLVPAVHAACQATRDDESGDLLSGYARSLGHHQPPM